MLSKKVKADHKLDKKKGIKEGSKKDNKIDKAKGIKDKGNNYGKK